MLIGRFVYVAGVGRWAVYFREGSLPLVVEVRGGGFGETFRVNGQAGGEAPQLGGDIEHARDLGERGSSRLLISDTAEEGASGGDEFLSGLPFGILQIQGEFSPVLRGGWLCPGVCAVFGFHDDEISTDFSRVRSEAKRQEATTTVIGAK